MNEQLGNRYTPIKHLGQGGMGEVTLVYDRLTRSNVALKNLNLQADRQASRLSSSFPDEMLIPIAHEFQMLASLKHPHIISVIDYGFDRQSQPFFTMDYLPEAETVTEYGRGRPAGEKAKLLLDLLQALIYIHRREILHRDLKPGNILVSDGELKLLDFGLASVAKKPTSTGGTLEFLAPELIIGESASIASDLYAFGVIAYELFEERPPFDAESPTFFHDLLRKPAAFDQLDARPALRELIRDLLAKKPADRPPTAESALSRFYKAMGWPPAEETEGIRESFLQAAQFVGRKKELKLLTALVEHAQAGRGGTFLIGGESGVGKSRLLDEIRIYALVQGCLVLNGQSVEGDSSPLTIWKEPLRRLMIESEPDAKALEVLHTIVPEIAEFFESPIGPPPELPEELAQKRLRQTIINQFIRSGRPIVLFLEDLHWEGEAFELLNYAIQQFARQRVVIIATYRTDEAPDLHTHLPDMDRLELGRLSEDAIIDLGRAILGAVGEKPEIQELVKSESEGNAFFLVEILRELAQLSGRLSEIRPELITESLLPKGIQSIVEKRLEKIPEPYQDLLLTVAMAGRALDLRLVHRLSSGREMAIAIDRWLAACADAAILEYYDNHWRFAHNKIRENLLQIEHRPIFIQKQGQIAQGLVDLYGSRPDAAIRISRHWRLAENRPQERIYILKAADHARSTWQNGLAVEYLGRALELTPEERLEARYQVLKEREAVYSHIGKRPEQAADIEQLTTLVETLYEQHSIDYRAPLEHVIASYEVAIGDHTKGIEASQKLVALTENSDDIDLRAAGEYLWGEALIQLGEWIEGDRHLNRAIRLIQDRDAYRLQAKALKMLGVSQVNQGKLTYGERYYSLALQICSMQKFRHEEANTLVSLGNLAELRKNYAAAEEYFSQASAVFAENGDQIGQTRILTNLCNMAMSSGNYQKAIKYADRALHIAILINSDFLKLLNILNLTLINCFIDDEEQCDLYRDLSKAYINDLTNPFLEAIGLSDLAYTYLHQARYAESKAHYLEAFEIAKSQDLGAIESEIRIGLAKIDLEQGEPEGALSLLQPVLDAFEENRDYLNSLVRSFFTYQVVYECTRSQNVELAEEIALLGIQKLEKSIHAIRDEQHREAYVMTSPGARYLSKLGLKSQEN